MTSEKLKSIKKSIQEELTLMPFKDFPPQTDTKLVIQWAMVKQKRLLQPLKKLKN